MRSPAAVRLLLVITCLSALVPSAGAAAGDQLAFVTFSQDCGQYSIGIAMDGDNLWYACAPGQPELRRADPLTGIVDYAYDVPDAMGLGAISYDPTRHGIWAMAHGSTNVIFIQLDAANEVASSSIAFSTNGIGWVNGWNDGLGYDATDDTLYYADDASFQIHQFTTGGDHLRSVSSAPDCYTSGVQPTLNRLLTGYAGCYRVDAGPKDTVVPHVSRYNTIYAEDIECDETTFDVPVVWVIDAYPPSKAAAYEVVAGECERGWAPPSPLVPELSSAALLGAGCALVVAGIALRRRLA